MAKTPAERKRDQVERDRKRREMVEDATYGINARTTFDEFYREHGDHATFEIGLDLCGLEAPSFDDNSGPRSFSGGIEEDDPTEWTPFRPYKGSLGRAEIMVDGLIDAAAALSSDINTYKKRLIADRLKELEDGDLSDPVIRKAALAETVALNRSLEKLEKTVRWAFPQWKLKDY